MLYGGVYRSPPAPQQRRPSAILPSEVFPDPPVGARVRQIVMAVVASQWIIVPPPQQRRPVVTEEAVIEVFVPQSQLIQHQTILSRWRVDPQLLQRRPQVTSDTPSVFIPKARDYDSLIVKSWHVDPAPQRFRPTAILPAEVFPDPPLGVQGRQYEQVIVGLWETVPAPQQRPSRAILPSEVFPDPPIGIQGRQYERVVLDSWYKDPQPQQRLPYVTEAGIVTTTKNFFGAIISDTVYVSESTVDPTTSDDVSAGYRTGSIWLNTSAGTIFMCLDPVNPAVWKQVSN